MGFGFGPCHIFILEDDTAQPFFNFSLQFVYLVKNCYVEPAFLPQQRISVFWLILKCVKSCNFHFFHFFVCHCFEES